MFIIFIIPVNFDGFHDDESGIYQYSWAVGQSVCSHDVVNFSDPHEFLHSAKHWTHNGYEKNLNLSVTKIYFFSVPRLNTKDITSIFPNSVVLCFWFFIFYASFSNMGFFLS